MIPQPPYSPYLFTAVLFLFWKNERCFKRRSIWIFRNNTIVYAAKTSFFKIVQGMQEKLKVIGTALMQKGTISKGIMFNTSNIFYVISMWTLWIALIQPDLAKNWSFCTISDILIMVNINSLSSELWQHAVWQMVSNILRNTASNFEADHTLEALYSSKMLEGIFIVACYQHT